MAIALAVRLLWEKTAWTWSRGAQMVGLSLLHIHPIFFFIGMLSSVAVAIWLLPGIIYSVLRRSEIGIGDVLMIGASLFVIVALAIPDTFFA